jgi:RNA polymerase sigma-32 factor
MHRKKLITKALKILNPREREIVEYRRLRDKPKKLEELSQKYKISRERVRQIEEKALEKLTKEISNTV